MKAFARLFAALAILLFVAVSTHANEAQLPLTEGVVKKLDLAAGKITIAHGEIVNLNMPPMTMSFKAKNAAMLKPWKEGDKVRFRAADSNGVLTLISIDAAK